MESMLGVCVSRERHSGVGGGSFTPPPSHGNVVVPSTGPEHHGYELLTGWLVENINVHVGIEQFGVRITTLGHAALTIRVLLVPRFLDEELVFLLCEERF